MVERPANDEVPGQPASCCLPSSTDRSRAASMASMSAARTPCFSSSRMPAMVVPAGEVDQAELRAHAAESLPDYMVPAAIVFLGELPLMPNGKLDRAALPEPDLAAAVGDAVPRDPTEEVLCELFAEVLGETGYGHALINDSDPDDSDDDYEDEA